MPQLNWCPLVRAAERADKGPVDAGVIFTNIVAVTGFVGLAVAGTATAKYWQVCCLFHTTCFMRLYWITRHCWRRQASSRGTRA